MPEKESLLKRLAELRDMLSSVADAILKGEVKPREARLAVKAYNTEINLIQLQLKYLY